LIIEPESSENYIFSDMENEIKRNNQSVDIDPRKGTECTIPAIIGSDENRANF
jgi:hypothetical protein